MKDRNAIWSDDRLGRRQDAEFLATFLRNRSEELTARKILRSYVLNVDAEWGSGKTFFLTHLQRHLQFDGHRAVYINAWRDDFAEDPLIAVMAAIDAEVAKDIEKPGPVASAWKAAKASGGKIAGLVGKGLAIRTADFVLTSGVTAAIGSIIESGNVRENFEGHAESAVDGVLKAVENVLDARAQASVDEFARERDAILQFRDRFAEFIAALEKAKHVPSPFFILIDELDRCRPPYAIALLERVKHLFETPLAVFVLATDTSQLGHSIKAVYGSEFSADRYLRRFFDRTYLLEQPLLGDFVQQMLDETPLPEGSLNLLWDMDIRTFVASFFQSWHVDLRTARQTYDLVRTICTTWNEPVSIQAALIFPFATAYASGIDPTLQRPVEALQRMSSKWTLRGRRGDRNEEIPVSEIAQELWDVGQTDLWELASQEVGRQDHPRRFAFANYRDELEKRYQGRRHGMEKRPSIILEYPRLVRQAGRLSHQEEKAASK